MQGRGFTIVELVITIAIMGILLVLGVVALNASQINARDTERKTDIESIALHLENYYKNVHDGATVSRYPSTGMITHEGIPSITRALFGIDLKSITAPNVTDPLTTFRPATSTSTTSPIDSSLDSPTINEYIYQPFQANGDLCTTGGQECRRFNLYYRTEADNIVHRITSKRQ